MILAETHNLASIAAITRASLGITYAFTGNLAQAGELLFAALQSEREIQAAMEISYTLRYLGIWAVLRKSYAEVRYYFPDSLTTLAYGGSQPLVPTSLEGLAGVARAYG